MRIVVIGGGLSGLGTAYRLSKSGYNVTLLEKEDHLGGLAASYLIDGFHIPKTYHHIMLGDAVTLNLISELGLSPDLYWRRLKTGFLFEKTTYDFSSSLSILKFKPLSFLDRIRFGLMVLKARRKKDWMHLDNVNVKDWVNENYGSGVYENLVKHIVLDKFNESPEKISAAWLISRFGHESRSVSGRFGYIKNGGIQRIIDRLEEEIKKNRGEIKTNSDVKKVEVNRGKVKGVFYGEDEEWCEADAVISTIPTPALLKVVPDFSAPYRKQLEQIRYKACVCVTLGLKEKVSKYYWLNIVGDYPFVGIFEHRHLNTEPTPSGVMYVVKYLDTNHSDWNKSDDYIVEHYMEKLEAIFPRVKDKVLWSRVFKAAYSTPVYTVNYGLHMPQVHSPINGLYITGISCIYPKDRYMGTALKSGFEAADVLMLDVQKS
jgi:protoporphyrinogen oxidase